jgi:hypothetical protein
MLAWLVLCPLAIVGQSLNATIDCFVETILDSAIYDYPCSEMNQTYFQSSRDLASERLVLSPSNRVRFLQDVVGTDENYDSIDDTYYKRTLQFQFGYRNQQVNESIPMDAIIITFNGKSQIHIGPQDGLMIPPFSEMTTLEVFELDLYEFHTRQISMELVLVVSNPHHGNGNEAVLVDHVIDIP